MPLLTLLMKYQSDLKIYNRYSPKPAEQAEFHLEISTNLNLYKLTPRLDKQEAAPRKSFDSKKGWNTDNRNMSSPIR